MVFFNHRAKESAASPEEVEANRVINRELLDDRKRLESEVKLLILGFPLFLFDLATLIFSKALASQENQPFSSK